MECRVENINVYYETYGEGKPIILIHGYQLDHRVMTGCMEPIFENMQGYKRIYIDLPGMGRTKAEKWIKNADCMLDILLKFIDNIIPNEHFLIAGESYGGYLSRGVVYKKMDMVDGMLLICPVIIANYFKRSLPKHIIIDKDEGLLSGLGKEDAVNFNSMSVVQNKEIWERYKQEIIPAVNLADSSFTKEFQEKGYKFSFNVDKLHRKFDKPCTFIFGRQDSVVGYKDAWEVLDNYPRASFIVLDKAGHNLQLEQKKLFEQAAYEWIDRTEKFK